MTYGKLEVEAYDSVHVACSFAVWGDEDGAHSTVAIEYRDENDDLVEIDAEDIHDYYYRNKPQETPKPVPPPVAKISVKRGDEWVPYATYAHIDDALADMYDFVAVVGNDRVRLDKINERETELNER